MRLVRRRLVSSSSLTSEAIREPKKDRNPVTRGSGLFFGGRLAVCVHV